MFSRGPAVVHQYKRSVWLQKTLFKTQKVGVWCEISKSKNIGSIKKNPMSTHPSLVYCFTWRRWDHVFALTRWCGIS